MIEHDTPDVIDPATTAALDAVDSPMARVRAKYAARQKTRTFDLDLWDGELVARVGLVDVAGARGALRTLASLGSDAVAELDPDAMADALAEAVVGLYERQEDGSLVQLFDEHGLAVRFDQRFGQWLGVPECNTARGAVLTVFTEGELPRVNAFALLAAVSQVAAWLADPTATQETLAEGS